MSSQSPRQSDSLHSRAWHANPFHALQDLIGAITDGAVLCVRPEAMTEAVIIAGLLPIMFAPKCAKEASVIR
jgi:Cu/Ag efflux pump CusA